MGVKIFIGKGPGQSVFNSNPKGSETKGFPQWRSELRKSMSLFVICPEFNKHMVEMLYLQAEQEFKEYQHRVKEILSLIESSVDLQTILSHYPENSPIRSLAQHSTGPYSIKNSFRKFVREMSEWELEPVWIPGAGEIPMMAQWLAEEGKAKAILALGVLIKGETGHYDFLCDFLREALWDLQKKYSLPIVFSVLMLEHRGQAEARFCRGAEGMKSLIQMAEWQHCIKIKKISQPPF